MLIGYSRTSTVDQVYGLDAQDRDLTAIAAPREIIVGIKQSSRSRTIYLINMPFMQ